MTSSKQAEANRRNARLSSGPRTAAGKQRASQNARKHGLSAAGEGWASEDVIALAQVVAGAALADARVRDAALRFAQAHLDLNRVRAVRAEYVGRWIQASRDFRAAHPQPHQPA